MSFNSLFLRALRRITFYQLFVHSNSSIESMALLIVNIHRSLLPRFMHTHQCCRGSKDQNINLAITASYNKINWIL